MKCTNCGAEISEGAKFCRECGKRIQSGINLKLKWGSMIASLVLINIFWLICYNYNASFYYNYTLIYFLMILFYIGNPIIIYIMYSERKSKMKYGRAWFLIPILMLLFALSGRFPDQILIYFLFLVIPAFIIDFYAIKKIYG